MSFKKTLNLDTLSYSQLKREVNLAMVPNEDGLGPSTALLYVARGIARIAQENNIRLNFIVQNKAKADFNVSAYGELGSSVMGVFFENEDSVIYLKKDGEKVLPMETAEGLLDYLWRSREYGKLQELNLKPSQKRPVPDAVICMGTPVAHVTSQSEKLSVPVIEIFDHSWPLSLEEIFETGKHQFPDDWRTRRIKDVNVAEDRFEKKQWPRDWAGLRVDEVICEKILPKIQQHDEMVDHVFMFPEPLAPGEFWCKWQSLAPGKVYRIRGVMGGWPDGQGAGQRETVRAEARKELASKLNWKSKDVESAKIMLVQGGGTPTWDRFLVHMLAQCIDWSRYLQDTLFLFTEGAMKGAFNSENYDRASVERRGWKSFEDLKVAANSSRTARLVSGTKKDFTDFQKFYLVSDLVFSRPGGITVQDAIACRTALVCAAEPGHWQTEKIRQHCLLHKIMRAVNFEAFQAGGIGLVLDQFGLTEDNINMVRIMGTIPNQQENELGRDILSIICENLKYSGSQPKKAEQGA